MLLLLVNSCREFRCRNQTPGNFYYCIHSFTPFILNGTRYVYLYHIMFIYFFKYTMRIILSEPALLLQ